MKNIKIDIPHFYCLEYSVGDKRISVEIDFREPFLVLSKKLITKWEPPYQDLVISEIEKDSILLDIQKYLEQRTLSSRIILED